MQVSRLIALLSALLLVGFVCWAQTQGDSVSAPIPGVGHDYIHMLDGTVNPANGSLSLRIQVPIPKSRGITVPFSFSYDSDLVYALTNTPPPWSWIPGGDNFTQGGWSFSVPKLSFSPYASPTQTNPDGSVTSCLSYSDFMFSDPGGVRHQLGMFIPGPVYPFNEPAPYLCTGGYGVGTDGQVMAVSSCSVNCNVFWPQFGSVSVYDSEGNQYVFTNVQSGESESFQYWAASNIPNGGVLPSYIEDRNGNQLTFGSNTSTAPYTFTYTDTSGRVVLQAPYLGVKGTPGTEVYVSGLANPYIITYEPAPASYSVYSASVQPVTGTAIPSVNSSQLVIKSIQLPNGQSYQFGYDSTYGLLNYIQYPDGGWVRYTWQMSSKQATLPGSDAPLLQIAAYAWATSNNPTPFVIEQYSTPVVVSRQVGYAPGSAAAQTQSFNYSSTWGSIPGYGTGSAWVSRLTKVITTDVGLNKSFETDYTYGFLPNGSYPWDGWWVSNQIPVENSVQYSDWNGSLLRTVTKGWTDQFTLDCQLETLSNNMTGGQFYVYSGYGLNISDEKDFDYGQLTASPPSSCYNSSWSQNGSGGVTYTPAPTAPSGPFIRETKTPYKQYAYPAQPLILELPTSISQYDSSGAERAETDYAYDEVPVLSAPSPSALTNHDEQNYSSSGARPRGNTTTITKQCFPNCNNAVTHYTYDETGQILTAVDPDQYPAIQYSYNDCYESGTGAPPSNGTTNAFLTQVIDSMGHQSSFCYGYADGELRSSTDPNAQITIDKYNDPLDRLTETDYPNGGQTTFTYNDNPSNPSVLKKNLIVQGQDVTQLTTFDGMGHVIGTELTDPEGPDYTTTVYDGEGRPYQVSNPYRSTTDPTYGHTTYSYDALGRTTSVVNPDNSSITTTYGGRATEVTDEGNGTRPVSRISQSDILGRLLSICEVTNTSLTVGTNPNTSSCGQDISGTGFLTTYGFDVLGNLLQVNQGALNRRNFTYDSLSRLTCSANPEIYPANCTSSRTGAITYGYDPNSNLTSKTAPLPNQTSESSTVTTTYQYDYDNRLIQKSYSDGLTPTANYQYDVCPTGGCPNGISPANSIHHVVEASTANSKEWNTYDPVGHIVEQWQCTPQNCGSSYFPLQYSYDLLGEMTSSTNGSPAPNNVHLTYGYDEAAHLTQVSSSLSGSNYPGVLFGAQQYTAAGLLANAVLGNGVTESFTHDNRERLQAGVIGNPSGSGSTDAAGSTSVSGSEQSLVLNAGAPGTGTITITGSWDQAYQYDPCQVYYDDDLDDYEVCEEGYPNSPSDYPWATDYGEIDVVVNGVPSTVYYDMGDTNLTLASRLATAIDDSGAGVGASASNGTVTLTAELNYAFSASSQTDDTSQFSSPSFWASQSGPALAGAVNPTYLFDSGTVSLSVATTDGSTPAQCSATYGSSDTSPTVASKLATAINSSSCSGFPLTASYSGSGTTINLTSRTPGVQADYYSITTGGQTSDPQYFSQPSFSLSTPDLSGGASAPLYTFSLGFAPDGDITSSSDSVNGNWTYSYDDFNRLTNATQSGQPSYSYVYDLYGNRWGNYLNGQCTAAYTSCLTFDSNNHISNVAVTYDAAGNVHSGGLHIGYYYDAESRLIQVDGTAPTSSQPCSSSATACYVYDANGQRVRKTAYGASVDYVYDLDGHEVSEMSSSGVWNRGEIYGGGRHIATYVTGASPTTVFDHGDWLGTDRARTNMSMQVCESETSLPFGDGLNTTGTCGDPSPMHFTGKERDTESGLDNFDKRYNASSMGRFMTPDPLPWLGWQHPAEDSSEEAKEEAHEKFEDWIGNPQNLNMYAYALNNPLRYTDPTGMSGCQAGDKTFSTCTITITYDPKTSQGTLVVTGQNKGDKDPTTLLTTSVVVGGDGHVTPTGTFTATTWEKDHVSTKYGTWADTPYSKTTFGMNAFGPYQLHIKELDSRGIYIHGTMGPSWNPFTGLNSLVSPTSHGCIRMCNRDDEALHNLMPNPAGNKIIIQTTPNQ